MWMAAVQEVEWVLYCVEGWWFDPLLLQSAYQKPLKKLLTSSCSPMHLSEYDW